MHKALKMLVKNHELTRLHGVLPKSRIWVRSKAQEQISKNDFSSTCLAYDNMGNKPLSHSETHILRTWYTIPATHLFLLVPPSVAALLTPPLTLPTPASTPITPNPLFPLLPPPPPVPIPDEARKLFRLAAALSGPPLPSGELTPIGLDNDPPTL